MNFNRAGALGLLAAMGLLVVLRKLFDIQGNWKRKLSLAELGQFSISMFVGFFVMLYALGYATIESAGCSGFIAFALLPISRLERGNIIKQ